MRRVWRTVQNGVPVFFVGTFRQGLHIGCPVLAVFLFNLDIVLMVEQLVLLVDCDSASRPNFTIATTSVTTATEVVASTGKSVTSIASEHLLQVVRSPSWNHYQHQRQPGSRHRGNLHHL
jgi:hypothetical protein